ncbi:hypothetical protein IWQ61_010615, partial [Dispira simplex]
MDIYTPEPRKQLRLLRTVAKDANGFDDLESFRSALGEADPTPFSKAQPSPLAYSDYYHASPGAGQTPAAASEIEAVPKDVSVGRKKYNTTAVNKDIELPVITLPTLRDDTMDTPLTERKPLQTDQSSHKARRNLSDKRPTTPRIISPPFSLESRMIPSVEVPPYKGLVPLEIPGVDDVRRRLSFAPSPSIVHPVSRDLTSTKPEFPADGPASMSRSASPEVPSPAPRGLLPQTLRYHHSSQNDPGHSAEKSQEFMPDKPLTSSMNVSVTIPA